MNADVKLGEPVRIDTGMISGCTEDSNGVRAYLGIPFAKPPVGQLRWRAPSPADSWNGTRTCTRFGAACLQPQLPDDSLMRQFSFEEPPECELSEDCLYLNVWTPVEQPSKKPLPVIVFVYGGGHRVGSGSAPVSRGSRLAAKGAIVVTVNYRVGALGYLAHPALTVESGTSGHYACLDLIAALEWVQRNAAAFGGDPNCVTMFGHSAGAALISVLMASPLSKALFHRAIVHSAGRFKGGPMGAPAKTLAVAEVACKVFTDKLGASTAEELRALDPLLIEPPRGFWGPIVDGQVLREPVHRVFERGEQLDIPLLAGYTRDEAAPYGTPELFTPEAFVAYAKTQFPGDVERFLQLYPHSTVLEATRSAYALRCDTGFAYQAWKFARLHSARSSSSAYLFNFVRPVPLPDGAKFHEQSPPDGYGAYHGSELWYVFGTMDAMPWPWRASDRALADVMSDVWVAFARTGDPDVPAIEHWPAFGASGQAMVFGDGVKVSAPFNAAQLLFFEFQFELAQA
ncbi:carboxylesterase/lipase family protein [Caballeronia sp. DA-9]|uniref:carboxylesterase/lipase family protein n=1 Tax=Caballeronia sp. DA-9 TaxID=3436237 RepID=UPI003F66977C